MIEQKEGETRKRPDKILARKLRLLQLDLIDVTGQIHNKSEELKELDKKLKVAHQGLDRKKLEKEKDFYYKAIDNWKEKIEKLKIESIKIKNESVISRQRYEEIQKDFQSRIDSLRNTVSDLGKQKSKLLLEIEDYKKNIQILTKRLQGLDSQSKSGVKKYQDDFKKSEKELGQLLTKKDRVEKETTQLEERKKEFKNKWDELERLQKYLNTKEKKISEKEKEVEKLFHLLSQK